MYTGKIFLRKFLKPYSFICIKKGDETLLSVIFQTYSYLSPPRFVGAKKVVIICCKAALLS